MSEHSPAPWKATHFMVVAPNGKGNNVSHYGGTEIAHTGMLGNGLSNQENEGNARLIAAAPELLAACKATVASFESHQLYDKCPLNLLIAAIAKAEGRS